MKTRGKWQGMLTIARFNWPFYLAAAAVLLISLVGLIALSSPLRWICAMAFVGALYFLVGSLGVSHLVYDRSDIYRWKWLDRVLLQAGGSTERMIGCHSGFDEVSPSLQEHFPETQWTVLDHFDEVRMTEPSIRRARRLCPPVEGTMPAAFNRWPLDDSSANVVLGILAIHEFRSESERAAWFSEAKRCLQSGGRIVIAEHLRDFANFVAFGPGFLHFHSRESWRCSWEAAGLHLNDELRVTPWVRIFVLSAND